MCLSTVFLLEKQGKQKLCENIMSVTADGKTLRFFNIMGVKTEVIGTIEHIDLMDNYIDVRTDTVE